MFGIDEQRKRVALGRSSCISPTHFVPKLSVYGGDTGDVAAGRLAAVARMKKYAFITFGAIFLVVGIVALAIPVLPTTPF